jgi:hypothetical protein
MRNIPITDQEESILYRAIDTISAQCEGNGTVTEALKDIMAILEME